MPATVTLYSVLCIICESSDFTEMYFLIFAKNDGPPIQLLGLFTQEGEAIPLQDSPRGTFHLPAATASPLPELQRSSPRYVPASPPVLETSPPSALHHSSPSRPTPTSAAPVENLQRASLPYDVVVTVDDVVENDVIMDDNYLLADEHEAFRQVAERSQRPQCGRSSLQRGRPRARGGRGSPVEASGSQWIKGDRLIEVPLSDDDVPEELRAMMMRVVDAREAARVRVSARARRQWMGDEEEWVDADDGGEDETLFAGGGNSARFEWSCMHDYSGDREQFLPQQTGPVVASENAYGAFRQYWDDGILSHIVTETYRHAAGLASSSASFARSWYDTNVHEILVLFSFWMTLGIIQMPSVKSCFTLNPLLQTNIFRKMFSRSRYENLCRALHFNDNSNRPTDNTDRLFCFGPILDHLNSRFKEAYIPSQNICIDESLTLWKGNLSFRQYIKTTAARFGVKT